MFSDKLLSLLQTFSKYDLNRFRKFLLSPYFNEQEDVTRLFNVVNQALRKPDINPDELEKTTVWKNLYPRQKLDDAHLRRLASDLTQLALRFLVEEARTADPLTEALYLQKALEKPELKKHLAGAERQLQKLLEEPSSQSASYYLTRFQMQRTIYDRASKVVATTDFLEKLTPADEALDHLYVIQKLKFYISWLTYKGFRSVREELPLMPGFWEYLQTDRFKSIPLVAVYQHIMLCLTEPDNEVHFHHLLAVLAEKSGLLAKGDLREGYQIAQNYCAFKINQGRTEYYPEVFRIYQNMIARDLLLEQSQLSESVFKNIITTGLRVGEFAWVEQFIEESAPYLPYNIRENARTFNLANLYSYQGKFNKVIELLRDVEYSDVTYTVSTKLILIRTYYETQEFLALDSLLDSFRIFLRRNQFISKTAKKECTNFLGFVKKLSTLSLHRNSAETQRLRQRIEKCTAVNSKKWLLEKMAEKI